MQKITDGFSCRRCNGVPHRSRSLFSYREWSRKGRDVKDYNTQTGDKAWREHYKNRPALHDRVQNSGSYLTPPLKPRIKAFLAGNISDRHAAGPLHRHLVRIPTRPVEQPVNVPESVIVHEKPARSRRHTDCISHTPLLAISRGNVRQCGRVLNNVFDSAVSLPSGKPCLSYVYLKDAWFQIM